MPNLDANSLGITLTLIGLIFMGVIGLLLRVVPRLRPAVVPVSARPASLGQDDQQDAVLLVQPGGRVAWMNAHARQMFHLTEHEVPNLERLTRRTRPADAFLKLCASEGQSPLTVEGRMVEVSSYWAPMGAQSFVLVSFRYPELESGNFLQTTGVSGQTLRTITDLAQKMASSLELKPTLLAILEFWNLQLQIFWLMLNGNCPSKFLGLKHAWILFLEFKKRA